jgi:DNA-directed RNA polymerase subunit M
MKFCEKCGIMIVPKRDGKKVLFMCSKCGKASNKRETIVLSEKVGDGKKSMVEVVDKRTEILPKVDEECPKCHNGKSYFWLVQTRAGDEAETRFFKCVKCNHTWREY